MKYVFQTKHLKTRITSWQMVAALLGMLGFAETGVAAAAASVMAEEAPREAGSTSGRRVQEYLLQAEQSAGALFRLGRAWCFKGYRPPLTQKSPVRQKSPEEIEKEKDKAEFDSYCKEANKGNVNALFNVAMGYLVGKGTEKNDKEALIFFEKTAQLGDRQAAYNAGELYEMGTGGVKKDLNKAIRLYTQAAEAGYFAAFIRFGDIYESNLLGKPDYKEALKWYKKLEENPIDVKTSNKWEVKRYLSGIVHLGSFYENGWGGQQNIDEALRLYKKAADQRNADGQYCFGFLLVRSSRCYEDARRYLELAAEQGHLMAQVNLGVLCENGVGGNKDLNQAAKWYGKAAAKGNSNALACLERVKEALVGEEKIKKDAAAS